MATESITDPVLGEGEIFFPGKKEAWATFKKEFPPTNSRVLILASAVNGSVPQAQRDLYRELEDWYPSGVQEAHAAIRREIESDEGVRKWLPPDTDLSRDQLERLRNWLPPDQVAKRLQLIRMDIRIPFTPPAKCVLTYRSDPNEPVWYVRVGEDFHVEWCGLGD